MSYSTLRQIVLGLGAVALFGVVAGWILVLAPTHAALPAETAAWLASALLAIPLGVHLAFLVVQGFPGGRRKVPLQLTRSQDLWLLIFVITLFGPKDQLAAWATPLWRAAETGVPISLVTATLAIGVRVLQLHLPEAFGVVDRGEPGIR